MKREKLFDVIQIIITIVVPLVAIKLAVDYASIERGGDGLGGEILVPFAASFATFYILEFVRGLLDI